MLIAVDELERARDEERGHAEHHAAPWTDIDQLIDVAPSAHPGARIHLGGHSSGAGLLLNDLTLHTSRRTIDRLVLLEPRSGAAFPLRTG